MKVKLAKYIADFLVEKQVLWAIIPSCIVYTIIMNRPVQ